MRTRGSLAGDDMFARPPNATLGKFEGNWIKQT